MRRLGLSWCRIAQKREEAVSREIMKRFQDDKRVSKKEKDERILWKKNEVSSCPGPGPGPAL